MPVFTRVIDRFSDLADVTWASFAADESPVLSGGFLVGEKLVTTVPAASGRNSVVTTADSIEGLRITATLTDASMSGPPAPDFGPVRLEGDYRLTNAAKLTSVYELAYTGLTSHLQYGAPGVATLGTGHAVTGYVNVLSSGSIETEQAAFMGFVNAGNESTLFGVNAPVSRLWGIDLSVNGPKGAQPRALNGITVFIGNHYNGDASATPMGGLFIVTKPARGGGGEDFATSTKYAVPVGFAIVGYGGPPEAIPESPTPDPNLRTIGFTVGARIGGYGSNWQSAAEVAGGARGSIIGTGLVVTDIVTAGVSFQNPIGTAASALSFDTDGVGVSWDWLLKFNSGVANPPTTGALMLPGGNDTKGQIRWGTVADANAPIIHRSANQTLNLNAALTIFPSNIAPNPVVTIGDAASGNVMAAALQNSAATATLFQEAAAGGVFLATAAPGDAGLKASANNLLLGVGTTEILRAGLAPNRFLTISGQVTAIAPATGAPSLALRGIVGMTVGHLVYQLPTTDGSPVTANLAAEFVSWGASGLLASRQPRWRLELEDFAATREAMRADADGTEVWTTIANRLEVGSHIRLPQIVAPGAPPAGTGALYAKADGLLYWKNPTTEYDLTTAGGGGMSIGGAVAGGTPGSLLFVGAGPVLAEDNANLSYDDAANRLSVANLTIGSLTGLLKATTGAVTTAVAGTDYVADLTGAVILAPGTDTRNLIQPTAAGIKGLTIRGAAGQSDNLQEWQLSDAYVLARIDQGGMLSVAPRFAITNAVNYALNLGHNSTATPAAGFGTGLRFRAETDGSEDVEVATIQAVWQTATHGSRRGRLSLWVADAGVGGTREGLRIDTDGSAATTTIPGTAVIGTLTGVLKAATGTVSVAVAGTDYIANLNDAVILAPATSTRNMVQPTSSSVKGLVVRGAIGQTESLQEWQDSGGDIFAFMKVAQFCINPIVTATATVTRSTVVGVRTTGTPAAGIGAGIQFQAESTGDENAVVGYLDATWQDPTHGSRRGRLALSVVDNLATREGLRIDTNGTTTTTTIAGTAVIGTLTGLLKATAGTVSAALAGTDYVANLDPAVLLAPAASTRNVLQPTGPGVIPFILRGAAAQSADLLQWQTSAPAVLGVINASGQIGVGVSVVNSSALLQLDSTTRGFLLPRMTTAERDAIATPATGLTIYNTTSGQPEFYNGAVWGGVTADLSSTVILAPATDARNVIVPTGDTTLALAVKQFSGSHSEDLFQAQSSAGAVMSRLTAAGALAGRDAAGADATGGDLTLYAGRSTGSGFPGAFRVQMAPGGASGSSLNALVDRLVSDETSTILYVDGSLSDALLVRNRNVASAGTPTRDSGGVVLNGHYWTGAVSSVAGAQMWLDVTGNGTFDLAFTVGLSDRLKISESGIWQTITHDAAVNSVTTLATLRHNSSGTPAAGFGSALAFQLESDTTPDQTAAAVTASWATATHASRRGRLALSVSDDLAAREGLRIDTDGAAATTTIPGTAVIGTLTGLLKATAGTVSAAVAGTDYIANLDAAVILAPTMSARNVIQPTGAAVVPLVVKGAASQSADHFQVLTSAAASVVRIDSVGQLYLNGSGANAVQRVSAVSSWVFTDLGANQLAMIVNGGFGYPILNSIRPSYRFLVAPDYTQTSLTMNDNSGGGDVSVVSMGDFNITTSFFAQPYAASWKGLVVKGAAGQTGDLVQVQNSAAVMLSSINNIGAALIRPLDAVTNATTTALTIGHSSSGTPAAGFGTRSLWTLESALADSNREALSLDVTWVVATDASRTARAVWSVYDSGGAGAPRECLRMQASGTAPMMGFFGSAAIAKPAVTGSRGGNAALASLLTQLATLGLVTDSTTA